MNTDYSTEISKERTPMESLILLLVILGLSDRQLVFVEREKMDSIISKYFPDHLAARYQKLLQSSISAIQELDNLSCSEYLNILSNELKLFYSETDRLHILFEDLKGLLEADGIIYSSESEMLNIIRTSWGHKEG